MAAKTEICPSCKKPGGILMFNFVGPCMKCQPDGTSAALPVSAVKNSKIPDGWTEARWVNNKGGQLHWTSRKYIEEEGQKEKGRKGTWGQIAAGDLEPYDTGTVIWTIEFR